MATRLPESVFKNVFSGRLVTLAGVRLVFDVTCVCKLSSGYVKDH